MVCEHQRPPLNKEIKTSPAMWMLWWRRAHTHTHKRGKKSSKSICWHAQQHPDHIFVIKIQELVLNFALTHCWHLHQCMHAPKILEEEMKIMRGKWLGFNIHIIQAPILPWEWSSRPVNKVWFSLLASLKGIPSAPITLSKIFINNTNNRIAYRKVDTGTYNICLL